MKFDRIGSVSLEFLLEVLPRYLNDIEPGLALLSGRVSLSKEDTPFMPALKNREKRVGLIELLDGPAVFPSTVLRHADWLAKNSFALAAFKSESFNADLPPFVVGLVPSVPEWLPLCAYLNLDITIIKFQAVSFQGTVGLILEPLFGGAKKELTVAAPISAVEEKGFSPFVSEAVNEMGLTEAEICYFSN